MRTIVVGLGIQGRKRRAVAGTDVVATVDPVAPADFRRVEEVPPESYDAALVCTPDAPKMEILRYLLEHGKHVLVEKPLTADEGELQALADLAVARRTSCYTAYNHRFEPHFVRMKEVLDSGVLGRIFHVRLFYGNGTVRDVYNSVWRDEGAGVLPDLGSHLLDTLLFWFGERIGAAGEDGFRVIAADRFENRSFDHIVLARNGDLPIQVEMSLVSWRNHFVADVFAEKGSAHIESLCKWGPSSFTMRRRVLPSGRPPEETVTLVQPDPTWAIEYEHFKELCAEGRHNIETDIWLNSVLGRLGRDALEAFPP
ncbi:Gfo/Idh/MocA family protein [Azospirillum rugosum]|uniref:Dehydrogenase n=1 Tax=Azospirillum rugosum TaxID=416170 RepID=A0ABS4SP06_9PROT|nr:Gfo/Idh/MocA family oxidoreductase [Azospirillum rugosum]MBP2294296.1 putative dehydrogenase [Azospirillum rugosum]MDQ0527631.1 putative dehydrogenase [Azospirillum rugosum]